MWTGRITKGLENAKPAWVDDDPFEEEIPHRAHLWTGPALREERCHCLNR